MYILIQSSIVHVKFTLKEILFSQTLLIYRSEYNDNHFIQNMNYGSRPNYKHVNISKYNHTKKL